MLRYLLRRMMLFLPTLIGATVVIFFVMALAPISIIDVLLPPGGDLLPGQRAVREQYIEERYGLNKPAYVQYLRWLNNISPIGFGKWQRTDADVVSAKAREAADRKELIAKLVTTGSGNRSAETTARKQIDYGPDAGDVKFDEPQIKAPDLGYSFVQSRPSWDRIRAALPVTLTLQLVSLPIAIVIALQTGVRAAQFRGQSQDQSISVILLGLYSLPTIWVGTLLIAFLANTEYLKWFPSDGLHSTLPIDADSMRFLPSFGQQWNFRPGYLLDTTWHLALPVICLVYGTIAYYSKLTRTSLLETLGSDFVRTARAKGLAGGVVLWRHAFRNSLIPLITVAASFLPRLVVGSVVVETIFGINGMGRLAVDSLLAKDQELFLSVSVLILVLQLTGNLLADVLYVIADPRVSYDQQ